MTVTELGIKAKAAAREGAKLAESTINEALFRIADSLRENSAAILAENEKDIEKAHQNGINEVMTDRLRLTEPRIDSIAKGVEEVAMLSSPKGKITESKKLANGLTVEKMRVPFGVIAIIYESRPNVTVDAAALTLKSGNAVILRGGKEAINSNIALAYAMRKALNRCGLNEDLIQIIEDTDRESARQLMRLDKYVDLLIPRGSGNLIRSVAENATVPVIKTGEGNCHIYCDETCDADKAVKIIVNAKTQRPSVCNAAESLVIHSAVAEKLLPRIKAALDEKNTEIIGCGRTQKIIDCTPASDEDFYKEYLDYKISCIIVDSIDEAIAHINEHSTMHSEAIITENERNASKFLTEIDSAAVYVNASTRFTDGNQFGLGAEMGISTQKLHVRGPMGLEALTSEKYVIRGNGQVRS